MRRHRKWIYLALLAAAIFATKQVNIYESAPARTVEVVPSRFPEDEKPLQVLQVVRSGHSAVKLKTADLKTAKPDWKEDLRLDHLCDLVAHLSDADASQHAQALMTGPGDVKPIDAKIKAVYLETLAGLSAVPLLPQEIPELDFYNALAAANLLSGSFKKNPSADAKVAYALLDDLADRDPSNGAPLFFQAKVWAVLFPSEHEYSKLLFLRAFHSPRFDTFYQAMLKRMHEKGLSSASYMMLSLSLTSSMAVPDYFESLTLLKTYIKEGDQDFNERAQKFGERLMQPGLRADLDFRNRDWSILEYNVGRAIAKETWQMLHPHSEFPPSYSQTHFKGWGETPEDPVDDDASVYSDHCDRRGFDRQFEKARMSETFSLKSH